MVLKLKTLNLKISYSFKLRKTSLYFRILLFHIDGGNNKYLILHTVMRLCYCCFDWFVIVIGFYFISFVLVWIIWPIIIWNDDEESWLKVWVTELVKWFILLKKGSGTICWFMYGVLNLCIGVVWDYLKLN